MNEKSPLNDFDNKEHTLHTEESDYKNLITTLKEISSIISLLEKRYPENL